MLLRRLTGACKEPGRLDGDVQKGKIAAVNRLPVNPLAARAIEVIEKRLGIAELSRRLLVSVATIQAWRLGHETMPKGKFLELVDILTELDLRWDEWNP